MNEWRDHRRGRDERALTISCDDCSMQCTAACAECVVSFVLRADEPPERVVRGPLVLDGEQARVVELFGAAGLVPELKYRVAG